MQANRRNSHAPLAQRQGNMRIASTAGWVLGAAALLMGTAQAQETPLYVFDRNNVLSTWSSPENLNGKVGVGAQKNSGAKGSAFTSIEAGATLTLLDVAGTGVVNRMWMTISDRSPEMLRALWLEMYWDGESKPAVSVPLGEFFGNGFGRTAVFQNAFFMNPEGRSFVSILPMPYLKGARVQIVNTSSKRLDRIYFDVDYQSLKNWPADAMYFHAYWHRDVSTKLAQDFELLPRVSGRGRYVGADIEVNANPVYRDSWWGEGEVHVFLNHDERYPTIAGTGAEDYFGTAYGLGAFQTRFSGCNIADAGQYNCYRCHVPDPIYFDTGTRVTFQQIGGNNRDKVIAMQRDNVPLIPVTVDNGKDFYPLYEAGKVANVAEAQIPDGWLNFYRSDDVAATAYFYLDAPSDALVRPKPGGP